MPAGAVENSLTHSWPLDLRALQGGVTTDKNFDFVRELRKDVIIPMVFMTYANVVFSYGTAAPEHIGAYVKSMKDALR